MKGLEAFLVFVVSILLYVSKAIYWIGKAIQDLIALLVFTCLFLGMILLIGELGSLWIKIFLFTGTFLFIGVISLAIWKPKRFNSLFKKILN